MTGTIFSIEEFSVFDGPGIRTSVFLKGCPLRCTWCHNPEGQNREREIVRSPNGCLSCGHCLENSEETGGNLRFTQRSIDDCPRHLIRWCGEEMKADVLCEKLMKNKRLLQQGGGVTFSGGEPLMQKDFLFACLERLKGQLHTAVQSCGFCDEAVFSQALKLSDYFLFDLKIADDAMHRRFTGVSNHLIRRNYEKLCQSGVPFITRIPLIPGVTDTEENVSALCAWMQQNGVREAEVLPYNKMAGAKYALAGMTYEEHFEQPDAQDILRAKNILSDFPISFRK